MTPKIQEAVNKLTRVFKGWTEVVAVAVNRYGDDRFDPYFSLSFDVYTSKEVRDLTTRELSFGDVGAFESALLTHKDRFIMDDLPVRIEYKQTGRFDELVSAAMAGECRLRDTGTYAFRRVMDAEQVFSRGSWLETLRASLSDLPERFWGELRGAQQASAEHLYADLSAAAISRRARANSCPSSADFCLPLTGDSSLPPARYATTRSLCRRSRNRSDPISRTL